MKAKEAPEKIYIQPDAQDGWFMVNNLNNTFVEYTRTDAFIKKVSEWLKDCATFTDMNGKKRIDKEMYKTTFDDFVNYVKGK